MRRDNEVFGVCTAVIEEGDGDEGPLVEVEIGRNPFARFETHLDDRTRSHAPARSVYEHAHAELEQRDVGLVEGDVLEAIRPLPGVRAPRVAGHLPPAGGFAAPPLLGPPPDRVERELVVLYTSEADPCAPG